MSTAPPTSLYKDLVAFFEERGLSEVASGLKQDLKTINYNKQEQLLNTVRSAISKSDRAHIIGKKNTNERIQSKTSLQASFSEMSTDESDSILSKLVTKLVEKPSDQAVFNERQLNAKIEQVFELNAFQKMVEESTTNKKSVLYNEIQSANSFIQKSQIIQQQLQQSTKVKKDLEKKESSQEILPRFGSNLQELDSFKDEHNNIKNLVDDLLKPSSKSQKRDKSSDIQGPDNKKTKNEEKKENKKQATIQNNDSIQQIAPAQEVIKDQEKNKKLENDKSFEPSMISSQTHDLDKAIKEILNEEGIVPDQNLVYNPKMIHEMNKEFVEEYVDDDDPGFDTYVVNEENFVASCQELARLNDFPVRAIKPDSKHDMAFRERTRRQIETKKKQDSQNNQLKQLGSHKLQHTDSSLLLQELSKKKKRGVDVDKAEQEALLEKIRKNKQNEKEQKGEINISILPKWVKFPKSNDEFYPIEFEKTIFDCYNLKVIFDREKTGFEESKDFPVVINSVIAGRYQVLEYLGSAAFSKAIQCWDSHTEQMVCMKIIENNKDYFDQSIDEIKLLRFIQSNCEDLDKKNLLKVIDHFYHKEHLFIVTELLRDNLYEYSKYSREVEKKQYFTVPRLQKITKQILNALNYIHDLNLIHCDLKPENILIKSYQESEIKVIDFGSSCFVHDHLSSYVQSRSYRAPEVILGCKYDYKIDIWSLGCILAELLTGYVLFQNDSVQGLLARVIGIIGPIPEYMMKEGKLVSNFFTREGLIYMEAPDEDEESQSGIPPSQRKRRARNSDEELKVHILVAKKTTLKQRMTCEDEEFVDFVRWLLEVDPMKRPTAKQALAHTWLTNKIY